tara:strand:- start:697 stop:915 length:219 start_codon:yes stop_codon:yes gene_type:complete
LSVVTFLTALPPLKDVTMTLFSTGFSTGLVVVVDNLTAFAGVAFLAVLLRVLVFLVPVVDLVDLVAVVGIKT